MSGINTPERAAAFTLDEDAGERKIEYSTDTKTTNAGTFRFNKEDHTVGNLLRLQLLRDPNVKFAGYIHPHPLINHIELKIHTTNSNVAPTEVLSNAIEDLGSETDHLMTQFQEAVEKWRKENEDVLGGN
jgi:DNA-directed RNA polymerase II subunit RPB11